MNLANASTRVHLNRTTDDETVLHEFADVGTAVSKRDLSDFSGIHPNTLSTTAKNRGCKTLLELKRYHFS